MIPTIALITIDNLEITGQFIRVFGNTTSDQDITSTQKSALVYNIELVDVSS